jgi:hypothetical protein
VYVGDEDGDFVTLASAKEKKVLSEVNMGSPVYSTPIVANGTMYVGTQTHLFAIADGAKPGQAAPPKGAGSSAATEPPSAPVAGKNAATSNSTAAPGNVATPAAKGSAGAKGSASVKKKAK